MGNGRLDGYRAPELPESKTPALLGRIAMRAKRVLLDTFTGKFFMVGPGGYELKLSPGSEVYDTEDNQAGHVMLPCSQFRDASRQQNKAESQVFMVGDYFSPKEAEASAALQRLSASKAKKTDSKSFQSSDKQFSETLDRLEKEFWEEADTLL